MSRDMDTIPTWIAVASLVLAPVAVAVDWWALWSAWSIVVVPLGAPALGWGHVVALRILAYKIHPQFQWADMNTKYDKAVWNLALLVVGIVLAPPTVWWLLPWLVMS